MTEFKIIPASEAPNDPVTLRGRPTLYPFPQMKVGEAFYVPADHQGAQPSKSNGKTNVSAAAYSFGRNNNMKFKCQRQKDGSVRVERIA